MKIAEVGRLAGFSVFVTVLSFLPSLGEAAVLAVNCDAPALPFLTVQAAVNAANPGDTVSVSGTCNENVSINEIKRLITLDGGGAATIHGPSATDATIIIRGRGITVRRFFSITGGENGISVSRGGTAVIDRNTIHNAAENGILVNQHSYARIINNTIHTNPRSGIRINESSSARIGFLSTNDPAPSPNTIQNNSEDGVRVHRSSNARIVGNVISNNGSDGVEVSRAAHADISQNTINGNSENGIFVTENSGVNLGNDTGTSFFDQPNDTTVNNGDRGIRCSLGGYANGRLGTLNGDNGDVRFGRGCINSLIP